MAKKAVMDTKLLNNLGSSASMKESPANSYKETQDEGIKNFSISFKMSEYKQLRAYCEINGISLAKCIKNLLKEKEII